MKAATWMVAMACVAMAMTLSACKSDEAGVKTNKVQQWTTVAAGTEKTTEAAADVLEEMKLTDVKSKSTGVDGEASGKMADGTTVNVSVKKEGSGSEVTVRVGTLGDSKLGADIASKIKAKAEEK